MSELIGSEYIEKFDTMRGYQVVRLSDYQALEKKVKELKEEKQSILNAMARAEKLDFELKWDGKSKKEALEKQVRELKDALQYVGKTFDDGWKDEDDEYWRTYLD